MTASSSNEKKSDAPKQEQHEIADNHKKAAMHHEAAAMFHSEAAKHHYNMWIQLQNEKSIEIG